MANEPTDEDRANAKVALISVQSYPSHSQVVRDVVAAALAAERERTVERCAKWHEEHARVAANREVQAMDENRYADASAHRRLKNHHKDSADAIRALGRGKYEVSRAEESVLRDALNASVTVHGKVKP